MNATLYGLDCYLISDYYLDGVNLKSLFSPSFSVTFVVIWFRADLLLEERIEYNDLVKSVEDRIDIAEMPAEELPNGEKDAQNKPGKLFLLLESCLILKFFL